ncbi:MAG: hypothetical protein BGP24_14865 [Lysobacterales bacterium 69-70]|nr:phage Gp37/Gp68 family protein [Xanthomonadaceae bacterium]ODU35365.1 MAG: hypothetical protein ABS97_05690 [Xanthomonadaceae bacterium SCN 69-320]ODV16870.1 MAG: hypothetical protein ABT27_19025 [Xanthomonadaceae bacterium SCN 69-25]OJY94260.1 MAG: hypothetical protein BGP24_14865 [Xanthomonadales bacterium 69-70]
MSDNTKIEWCDATFNPWMGCTKISPGCDNCYAAVLGRRFGVKWGAGAPRFEFDDKHWDLPRAWNRRAERKGRTMRVFCASMADVFDADVPQAWRDRLFALIRETPHLTWLLLTKRIGNVERMLPADWGDGYANVQLGATIVNQAEADRDVIKLLRTRARVRFVSIEPMLGPVRLWLLGAYDYAEHSIGAEVYALSGLRAIPDCDWKSTKLDWVICGGESGHGARPMHPDWVRSLRDQCAHEGTPFLFKQWGEWLPGKSIVSHIPVHASTVVHDGARGYATCWKVGKHAAGRLLDGVEHNAYPVTP